MAKQTIGIGASANDGSGDPLRIAFDKVNDNFNELYSNGGTSGTTLIDLFDSSGNLDLYNKSHKISFLYNSEAILKAVNPSTYHGAIGHAHDTGSLYYAHGSWRKLLSDNSNNDITSYVDPLSKHVYLNNISNTETADYILKTNADGTYTWIEQPSGGGGGGSFANTDVDGHLNTSTAANNEVLSWTGTDYDWVATNNNAFNTVTIAGTDLVASGSDTLNLVAGANITLTANAASDTVTIASGGGGGGGGTDLNSLSAGVIDVAADSIGFIDNNDSSNSKKETIVDLIEAIAGNNLTASNGVLNASGGSVAMTDVTDTTITSPQSNDILKYFGNDNTWRNVTFTPTYADISQQPTSDKALFENSFLNASTVLKVTHNGSSSYRFDQYGTTDNPTIYVKAGTTVGFDLTDAGGVVHPFVIQTSGGSDYNEGLFALDDGNYYSGSNANAGQGGALFWKVPADISGNYKYVCQAHSGMTGTIVVEAAAGGGGGGGGGGASRVTETETTASIAAGASGNVEFATLGKAFSLLKVTTNKECWVRIYSDTTARSADAGRTQGTDPADGSGVIAEFISTSSGSQEFKVTPGIMGWLDDSETEVPVAVKNNTSGTTTVQVTINALKIES